MYRKKRGPMRAKNECIPCVTRQLITLAEKVTSDTVKQETIIAYGLKVISDKAFEATPPYLSGEIYKQAKLVSGISDPYLEEKTQFNKIAQDLIEKHQLRALIESSKTPLESAIRLSIAGNIIDFSLGEKIDENMVEQSLQDSLNKPLYGNQINALIKRIQTTNKIMILADNAGEIVFDQLMIEFLGEKEITYVVKGGPIVNDATRKDAIEIGLDQQVILMDTGAEYQGIVLEASSPEFIKALASAELIISKGQANYESLNEYNHDGLYFLLRGKCLAIADVIGCEKGDFVCIKQSRD